MPCLRLRRLRRPALPRLDGVAALACVSLLLALKPAAADESVTPRHFKLTAGNYFYRDPAGNYSGQDLNLRYRRNDTSAWIGYYHDRQFGGQARIGFDTSWQPFDSIPFAILPSAQAATKGFVGGSLAGQIGDDWFAQVGIGRTNLRPYQNLNFDPNDSLNFALGHHAENGSSYTLSAVVDDRLHTGQRHYHATAQWPIAGGQRLTIDVLHKRGNGDTGRVVAWGETITYDFPRWFLREAYDPKQNFGSANVVRLSAGVRF